MLSQFRRSKLKKVSDFLAKNNNQVLDLMAENEALKAHNHRLRKRWEELTSLSSAGAASGDGLTSSVRRLGEFTKLMSERDGDDCRLLGLLQVMVVPHAEAISGAVLTVTIVVCWHCFG